MPKNTPDPVSQDSTARKRMRTDGGGYRRDRLRALAQRVEVDTTELLIYRMEKRAASHIRRRLKRKNGGLWRSQFCSENGALRPTKMGNIASPWRYACCGAMHTASM